MLKKQKSGNLCFAASSRLKNCILLQIQLLYQSVKTRFVGDCQFGNLLSVKLDVGFLQCRHKYAVFQAADTACRIYSGNPELAEFAPADSAVAIGVNACVHLRVFCEFVEAALVAEIASGCFQNTHSSCARLNCICYSWHVLFFLFLMVRGSPLHPFDAIFYCASIELCKGHCGFHVCRYAFRNFLVMTCNALLLYRFAAEQVAFAGAAAEKFTACRQLEAF